MSGIFVAALGMVAFPNRQVMPKVVPALLAVSGFMLPLYKDTTVPVVVASFMLMVVIRVFATRRLTTALPSTHSLQIILWFGVLPAAAGTLLSVGYQFLKYRVPWPLAYLAEAKATTPALSKSLEFLLGSVFSPNGGIVVFWYFSFFVAIVGWRMLGLALRNHIFGSGDYVGSVLPRFGSLVGIVWMGLLGKPPNGLADAGIDGKHAVVRGAESASAPRS